MRRLLRWLSFAIAGVLTLMLCVVLALTLPPTRRKLAHLATEWLSTTVRGSFDIEEVHALHPWHVHLSGVRVLDDSGASVGSVDALEVRLAPLALLGGTLRLREVHIQQQRLPWARCRRATRACWAP